MHRRVLLHGGALVVRCLTSGAVSTSAAQAGTGAWTLGYRPSLDALRGIAVVLVMLQHFDTPGMGDAGSVGVALFFALSGYLITGLLIGQFSRRGKVDLRAFYASRMRRLLPALFVLLAVVAFWMAARGALEPWLRGGLAVALYAGNWAWIWGWDLTGVGHTWSLAIEEQFYLLWPFALVVLLRYGPRPAIGVTALLIGLSFLVTGATLGDAPLAYAGSGARMKDLLIGCLVALVAWHRGADLHVPTLAAAAAAAFLAYTATGAVSHDVVLLTPIPCAIIVAWVAEHRERFVWRPLVWTGLISYGLYLYHYPFAYGPVGGGMALPWPLRLLVLGGITFVLAAISYRYLEMPTRRRSVARDHQLEVEAKGVPGMSPESAST